MVETSCWELVKRREFDAACDAADRAARRGRPRELRNKVFALLNLGRFGETVELCSKMADAMPAGMGGDLIMAGVAFWLMEKHENCIDVWRHERNAKYADAAGGMTAPLLLHFAGQSLADRSLQDEAVSLIGILLGSASSSCWPGPVGDYVLGRCSAEEMLSRRSAQAIVGDRQLCVANFHIGASYLHSDSVRSIKQMSLALHGCSSTMLEPQYYLAKGQLVRQGLAQWK